MKSEDGGLTEEQVAQYDRQIRLWGYETQRKLMATEVAIDGVDQVKQEVSKNLAAAGVNMCIIDPRPYTGQFTAVVPIENMFEPMPTVADWLVKGLRRMNSLIHLRTASEVSEKSTWLITDVAHDSVAPQKCRPATILICVAQSKVRIYVFDDLEGFEAIYGSEKKECQKVTDTPAYHLTPSEAAVVGGLIAQHITGAIDGKAKDSTEDLWNMIEYDRENLSATTKRHEADPGSRQSKPSANKPERILDIDD